jgi:transcription elongation factor GreA
MHTIEPAIHDADRAPLLTRVEYDLQRRRLEELRRIRDRDLPELLRDARALVSSDAEEERAQILDDHAFVETRIAQLEALLRDAHVVPHDTRAEIVCLGRVVEVEYTRSGQRAAYRLAGAVGPDTVSAASPVGRALMGRAPGDLVSVELPYGRTEELRIVSVGIPDAAA